MADEKNFGPDYIVCLRQGLGSLRSPPIDQRLYLNTILGVSQGVGGKHNQARERSQRARQMKKRREEKTERERELKEDKVTENDCAIV